MGPGRRNRQATALFFARRDNRTSRGHGDHRPASERTDARRDLRARTAACDVHRRHFRERGAAVHGAADVHQDGAAALRRCAVGVVGCDGVLPGRPAGGLRLRPLAHALCGKPGVGRDPSDGHERGRVCAAAVDRRGLGPATSRRGSALADRTVRGLDRPAVLRACRQRPAAAGLVRAYRSPGRERPLLPLCRQQCRKRPCAPVLSDRGRTVRAAGRSSKVLVARLLSADRAPCRLRRTAVALPAPAGGRRNRRRGRRAADVA